MTCCFFEFGKTTRRVARIWKRGGGGLFWKNEKSANDLYPNFHCSWSRITRYVQKLRRNFSESSEIQTFFQPKTRWSPKKKSSSPNLRLIIRPKLEIQTFFQPKNKYSLKKKKGLHRNWDWFFGQNLNFKRFFRPIYNMYFTTSAPNFLWGGAVFYFSPKIGLKSTKKVQFYILHKPMGGSIPPPPGYATENNRLFSSLSSDLQPCSKFGFVVFYRECIN